MWMTWVADALKTVQNNIFKVFYNIFLKNYLTKSSFLNLFAQIWESWIQETKHCFTYSEKWIDKIESIDMNAKYEMESMIAWHNSGVWYLG